MRILMIGHGFPPTQGGVETHVADLTRILSERGDTVSCLVGAADGENNSDRTHGGIRVHRRTSLRPEVLIRTQAAGQRIGDQLVGRIAADIADIGAKADLIHCHNMHHFGDHAARAVFAEAGARPVINTVHDHAGNHVLRDVLGALPWTHLIYVSHFIRDRLPSPAPGSVLHLGVPLDRFRPDGPAYAPFDRLERPVIFHPARLLEWKGVGTGLTAFARIRAGLGQGTLVLTAGSDIAEASGPARRLRDRLVIQATRDGVRDHVVFTDVPYDRMPDALRASDLVWYPTTGEEPYGLVPLEAMGCGVPVITSDSGGMAETMRHDETGLVVPRGDADTLADAAHTILTEAPLRDRLVKTAQEHVQAFDLDTYADRLRTLYADVLAR